MYCPDCGKQTPEGRRYCVHCGSDLNAALTPPPTTPGAQTPGSGTPPPPSGGGLGDKTTAFGSVEVAEITPGTVIAERYEVVRLLGKGGMGAVYEVLDRELGETCALKVMHPYLLASERAVERFVQEARVSLHLAHPHIVRIRDLGRTGELRYLTMELLEGRSLREWLTELKTAGRLAPLPVVVSIVEQVLEALAHAHRRTIHRDIKPENIFLCGEEPGFQVKLLDFGIAKALDRETLTSTSSSMGTAWYVAPEQLEGARDVDARADLFSVGAVLYELLTGTLPYGRLRSPSEVREGLDPGWDELVFAAMDPQREDRPRDATAFRERVRALVPGHARERAAELGRTALTESLVTKDSRTLPGSACPSPGEQGGERCVVTLSGVHVAMRWIPPGSDHLGSPRGEPGRGKDETPWQARFAQGFWMGETQVTQALWEAVTGEKPSYFNSCGPTCPVETVSWDDINRKFLPRVNGQVTGGCFRLPTEAEWEYAARAGRDGPFGLSCPDYGQDNYMGKVPCLDRFAWYRENSGGKTHRVGKKAANAWGLHDMHGNVWEPCQDWYGKYPLGSRTGYAGPSSGDFCVLRGGSWYNSGRALRSAYRGKSTRGYRRNFVGFRLVWVLSVPHGSGH